MDVTIFIFCYNEEVLIAKTIAHYRLFIPQCNIVILDNYSTDNSVKIAKSLGCKIHQWKSRTRKNVLDLFQMDDMKNNIWKSVKKGWVIVCDMDEWLCVTHEELDHEERKGTTVIRTRGYNIVGDSRRTDLVDIEPESVFDGVESPAMSKYLCFHRPSITDINYYHGAHGARPEGVVKYSCKLYLHKHLHWIGLPYRIERNRMMYARTRDLTRLGHAIHYFPNDDAVKQQYQQLIQKRIHIDF
jgi:glycosyltransferase involved in cell wall biosynthesis